MLSGQLSRSEQMALVRSKDTKPEMAVRRLVHSMGYRYRLHDKRLPGKPDMVFPGRRKVVMVNGCFWHRHGEGCRLTRTPKSNLDYWQNKFQSNLRRDAALAVSLAELGYQLLVVWECEARSADLADRIRTFLDG